MLNGMVMYNVTVVGVDMENDNTILSSTTTVSTTDHVLQYSVEPFSEYTVTVVPVTDAGGGNASVTSFVTPEGSMFQCICRALRSGMFVDLHQLH